MKTKTPLLCTFLVVFTNPHFLFAQGTAFTYQGRLTDQANPASGNYDLMFALFNTNASGVAIAGPVTNSAVFASNGLFTTDIDLGAGAFTGDSDWLEIAVRTNGNGIFNRLTPRQQLRPTPYAITAGNLAAVSQFNTVGVGNIFAAIGGGQSNTVSGYYSAVNGGFSNLVTGNYSSIGGGDENTASDYYAFVGGGDHNTASVRGTTVSGGENNTASGGGATVSGGADNTASGDYAVVVGGTYNAASGDWSFAAGSQAQALYKGDFVWADTSGGIFSSTADNQFSVRAAGGIMLQGRVGIGTSSPLRALQVGDSSIAGSEGMIHLASRTSSGGGTLRDWEIGVPQTGDVGTGEGYSFVIRDFTAQTPARLMVQWGTGNVGIGNSSPGHLLTVGSSGSPAYCDGGSWVNGSDRNVKENFSVVNPVEVLDKVASLPISQWQYKADANGVRHLGPMAQDFYAAFNIGPDDRHIATVDEEGVALAAIQGLNQKVENQKEELKKKETEITELRKRFEALELIVLKQKGN